MMRALLPGRLIAAAAVVLTVPMVAARCVTALSAQAPAFDVASIRENRAGQIGPAGAQRVQMTGGTRAYIQNVTLRTIIAVAFRASTDDVEGGPSWIGSAAFDIDGRTEAPVSAEAMRVMLRALLADRFGLVAREVERQVRGDALVLARRDGVPGPNLKPADRSCLELRAAMEACATASGPDHFNLKGVPMSEVAGLLGAALRRPLVDGTGLDGLWSFDVRWTFPWKDHPDSVTPEDAIEQQLGLKLVERTVSTRKVVVTAVSRPTEN